MAKKILAVDDERHIVRLIEVNLQRAGYEVVTAFDGQEALEKAKTETPDLIVLDVMMPEMDGFDVLKNLKADTATRDLPVLMLTAKCADADAPHAWVEGSEGYLTKPFNPMDLLRCIKAMFDGSPLPDPSSRKPMKFKLW